MLGAEQVANCGPKGLAPLALLRRERAEGFF